MGENEVAAPCGVFGAEADINAGVEFMQDDGGAYAGRGAS